MSSLLFFIAIIFIILIIAFCVAMVILQIYLSRKESKIPGLILPIITLGFSLISIFGIAMYSVVQTNDMSARLISVESYYLQEIDNIHARAEQAQSPEEIERLNDMQIIFIERVDSISDVQIETNWGAFIARLAVIFTLQNIPTIILLAIYFACRSKRKQQHALNLMSIQDL